MLTLILMGGILYQINAPTWMWCLYCAIIVIRFIQLTTKVLLKAHKAVKQDYAEGQNPSFAEKVKRHATGYYNN